MEINEGRLLILTDVPTPHSVVQSSCEYSAAVWGYVDTGSPVTMAQELPVGKNKRELITFTQS